MLVDLKIWTPDGDVVKTEIENQADLVRELRATGQKYCCRASDLDYQVGDGIRVTGDVGSSSRRINVSGLTPAQEKI